MIILDIHFNHLILKIRCICYLCCDTTLNKQYIHEHQCFDYDNYIIVYNNRNY